MSPWDTFFREKITKLLTEKGTVIDIGGGLRITKGRGNKYDASREWILPYLERVNFKVLDPVPDYNPDIVGDIHTLPFENASVEAIICIAVLEHVEDPIQATRELVRVLAPGGYCFVYVPFLYYYHAEKGYYGDFWRYTEDALRYLFRDCSKVEIQPVRGAIETWVKLSPFGRISLLRTCAYGLDRLTRKINSKQVSGYHVFITK